MSSDWVQVYDLARDREYVERVQKVTVEGGALALASDHGLFGSRRWWEALRDGVLPRLAAEGVIARVGVNASSWPEFELESGGERSSWALEGDPSRYPVGARARVEYVMQRYARPAPGHEDRARVVIGIWVRA
jgi:hypothetical protein